MREFIYLSDAKLRQFIPKPRRLRRAGALRLSTPVGGIDLDAPATDADSSRQRQLAQVVEYLEEAARWFTEPDLRAGQWIQFEAPLRYITLKGDYRDMVLFVDSAPGEDPEYESAACRLIMHGSARHLLGLPAVPVEGPLLTDIDGGCSMGTTFITAAGRVVRAMAAESALTHDEFVTDAHQPCNELSAQGVCDLLKTLDAVHAAVITAAWVQGYARVTTCMSATDTAPRCVVASPLTVEYAHDLP
ncbi:SAVMC3_10250 family protein [Streptomyces sp. CB02959]|uniref:SAVMC3_10250 family protein n=1 Tax=Streptomyces sp. CB02959 TaxID=2020330 RepID=UPI0011AEE5EC|nr:SAVMC3_10250 family protein [Streptomyces sp. CB02959]